jgi:hypothetical protein
MSGTQAVRRGRHDPELLPHQRPYVQRRGACQDVQQAHVEVAIVQPLLEMAGVGGEHAQFDPRVIPPDGGHQGLGEQFGRALEQSHGDAIRAPEPSRRGMKI